MNADGKTRANAGESAEADAILAKGLDVEPLTPNQRDPGNLTRLILTAACIGYTAFHILVMNLYPLEPWTYRMIHITGGLVLGFLLFAPRRFPGDGDVVAAGIPAGRMLEWVLLVIAAAGVLHDAAMVLYAWSGAWLAGAAQPPAWVFANFGPPLAAGTASALAAAWLRRDGNRAGLPATELLLCIAAATVCLYILFHVNGLRMRAGTALARPADMWAALVGVVLILEVTRRLAGLALVVIAAIFVLYSFVGPYLPGILEHRGYSATRFFSYIYTDNGILGPTTAISSTYIILFVTFAAFLQTSKVGDYFVNFAFAAAGRARGGPAKVAVFASGLMGMINGTSAGNVVSTGSLTIPLMKRVGYRPQTSAAIEAAASSGGQIMPPIMGAGAFIMAEITGIPYTEIVIAAIIPSLLYFLSVYFMVDLEATRFGMKGLPSSELPRFRALLKQVYLFVPIIILIYALFVGYSVIRAGTLAMAAAAMVSWLTPHAMGVRGILQALNMGARMALQLVAVCACAGIIVGVIALTGIGTRFASLLLALAEQSQLLALIFTMLISIILGMGMPTTAAYAVAASVIGPGLVQLGIPPLTAHFFIFYYAVMSAITPPVALAAYAGAALAGSDPMRTSVESFKIGLAAFVVPFMFFYSSALLMQGVWYDVLHVMATASVGVYLLSCAVLGWFFGRVPLLARLILLAGALSMIAGGIVSDVIGATVAISLFLYQRRFASRKVLTEKA